MPRIARKFNIGPRAAGNRPNRAPLSFIPGRQPTFNPNTVAVVLQQNRKQDEVEDELIGGDWISTTDDWADGDWLESNT